jgi:long-chain acyl-CoA synthetase
MAAVIGTPDEKWGEAVTALIVKKGEGRLEPDDIKTFARTEIAGYKVPKKIIFIESLPLSASGKILKYKLREEFYS